MSKPVLRDVFDPASRESDLRCEVWDPVKEVMVPEPSLAQQSFKDDADINVLLERFKVTGVLPQGLRVPSYGDFTGISDFRSAANVILNATNEFMQLPANIRSRFGNDPQQFLEFCSDSKNLDEMRKMGLAVPVKPEPEPMAVRVVSDPAKPEVNATK